MENNKGGKRKYKQIEVDYIADGAFYTGFTHYIGEDGLFIITQDVSKAGNIIFIDMYLPNYRHKLKLKCRVLKSFDYSQNDTPPGMEVEYLDLKEQYKKVLSEFIGEVNLVEDH